jgi:5-methyltetrahydrofolate--homocysteine methyltransferase
LFRLSWGAKNQQGAEWEKTRAEFESRLAKMSRDAKSNSTLVPRAVYGFFPANSSGDDLIIYDPAPFEAARRESNSNGTAPEKIEIARFTFPRQDGDDYLCISDYYRTVESGEVDVVALQVVTVGEAATERFDALQAAHEYTEAYFFHGLAVQAAEATAQYVNLLVRRQLGLEDKRGKRYSWGYPACPELSDHQTVLRLLPEAESKLGMSLTSAYQWLPEQSTAAIFAHHPDAKYYSVGVSRTEQLTNA